MEKEYKGIITIYAKSRAQWRAWLKKNHNKQVSIWLIIYRKSSETKSVYYSEAVEEALCFGWIDSKGNKRDEESYYQFFAKRNSKSKWSKINKAIVKKLISEGLMTRAGKEMIDLAKKSGTWSALDTVDKLIMPSALKSVFAKNKTALNNWNNFPPSTKKGILEWISSAKKEETQRQRILKTVSMATKNERANQYNKK